MSDSLQPCGLQHTRFPCPLSPGVCSVPCPLSLWGYLTISSSVVPFFFCLQSFPARAMSPLFTSGGQSTRASALAFFLLINIQGWLPLGLTGLISLQSRDSEEIFPIPHSKRISSLALSPLCGPTLTSVHGYWKNHSFDYIDLCQ